MELIGKIKAKIHAHTFDGVPEDIQVTIFIPGVSKPIKGMLTDIEIEGAAKAAKAAAPPLPWAFYGEAIAKQFSTGVKGEDTLAVLKEAIPGLDGIRTGCPHCIAAGIKVVASMDTGGHWSDDNPLTSIIMHLNDYHGWTRQKIADWLDTKDWDLQFTTPPEKETTP